MTGKLYRILLATWVVGLAACDGDIVVGHGDVLPDDSAGNGDTKFFSLDAAVSAEHLVVDEGDSGETQYAINVELSTPVTYPFTVDYITEQVTAQSDVDYLRAKGTLSFEPGEVNQTIHVTVYSDEDVEHNEYFEVRLYSSTMVVETPNVVVTIEDDDAIAGLSQRPVNAACVAPDAPTSSASVTHGRVFGTAGDFSRPVGLVRLPHDSTYWYVVEQDGTIRRFENTEFPDPATLVLDISSDVDTSSSESGLLGLAFHPDFENNGYAYVSYTTPGPFGGFPFTSRLSRFESTDGGVTLDASTETILLSLEQPDDSHNGGHITFGPDGYLYLGMGDGGGDPNIYGSRSQNTKNLFGSIMRIDVDGGTPYGIPADNPFAGNALCAVSTGDTDAAQSCPEIFAWGFRNPWRYSFDRQTGDLWMGDVGQNTYEEINLVEAGGNYGWNVLEGPACFEPSTNCDTTGLIPPVVTYDHTLGFSVTGGFVYRGSEIPELFGRYLFIDFVTQRLFALVDNQDGTYSWEILLDSSVSTSAMAEDENGEIYLLRYGKGFIHRLRQSGGVSNNTIPDNLFDTQCIQPGTPEPSATGMIPYETIGTFWSDGADKRRFMAIPDGTTVDVGSDGDWEFPTGTVLMKHFRLDNKMIETRLYMRHTNGEWGGYTYEWSDDGLSATRVIGGKTRDVAGQTWIYPSESQCFACHTDAAGISLGPEQLQLNSNVYYPTSGQFGNQLTTADSIGWLTDPLSAPAEDLTSLVDPDHPGYSLELRARSYLHTNCSGCHRPLGPTPSNLDFRFQATFAGMNACDVTPGSGSLGIADAKLIAPGDADRSIVVERMSRRDAVGMPPVASAVHDATGVALLSDWINSLDSCP